MREDGSRSPNRTDKRFGVFGADTSSMFSYRGKMFTLFQDNFGAPADPFAADFFSVEWFYPQHGDTFDAGTYINVCTGDYVGSP